MKAWIVRISIGLLLFVVFLLLSFPWHRLGPKIARTTEDFLANNLRDNYSCELLDFGLAFPLGIKAERFRCQTAQGEVLFVFDSLKMIILPFYQSLNASLGEGSLKLATDANFSGKPNRLKLELQDVDLQKLLPLVFAANNAFLFSTPVELNVEGRVNGGLSLPLNKPQSKDGYVDLQFSSLRLPSQLYLDLIGLRELRINPAVVNLRLESGSLNFNEVAFISQDLSGKIEGSMKLEEPLENSAGNVSLKWKIQRSDALLSSPIGSQLLNAPCPSPDAQGFCTRKITRYSELSTLMQPGGFR